MSRFYILAVATLFCAACASPPQPISNERYVWPPPPDVARIEWLKSYTSQLDIEKTATQLFWESIAGEDPPRPLLKPVEVKSVPELNKFFVSDIGLAAVVVFDLAGHEMRTLKVPDEAPKLLLPLSVALDSKGYIYLLERRSASILVFDPSEKYQRAISLKSVSVKSPTSMAIDKKNDRIYVSDAASHRIVVIDQMGGVISSIGEFGNTEGQFNLPVAIALDSKGRLIVADAFNARIQIFSPDGRYLSGFGRRGVSVGSFQLIKSVAVDSSDNIYVVDGRAHNISIFNDQGELLLALGGFYAATSTGKIAPGGFSMPVGIDIDSTDKIYVVDQMNSRVQVFKYLREDSGGVLKAP